MGFHDLIVWGPSSVGLVRELLRCWVVGLGFARVSGPGFCVSGLRVWASICLGFTVYSI